MELVLNLLWALLTALLLSLWVQLAPRSGRVKRLQFIALAMLLVFLFPVISVTDDLQTAQNPAEADCCLRRDYGCAAPHSMPAPLASLPPSSFTGIAIGFFRAASAASVPAPALQHPERGPIQNRPPPSA